MKKRILCTESEKKSETSVHMRLDSRRKIKIKVSTVPDSMLIESSILCYSFPKTPTLHKPSLNGVLSFRVYFYILRQLLENWSVMANLTRNHTRVHSGMHVITMMLPEPRVLNIEARELKMHTKTRPGVGTGAVATTW
ncbi:unnamed protein product [Allacma fusca]|uniref:Uncharacterized protein n=1 Tax=Allacma fusca TaxID=39272 RepID=A0A8J2NMM4_9HEXA|nr:unnamed protein product [Allacma fusca]